MADDKNTIRVKDKAFKKAKQQKQDAGQTWDEYVADENRGTPDPREVAIELAGELNTGGEPLGFDDVKAAVRAALRDELPVDDMGR